MAMGTKRDCSLSCPSSLADSVLGTRYPTRGTLRVSGFGTRSYAGGAGGAGLLGDVADLVDVGVVVAQAVDEAFVGVDRFAVGPVAIDCLQVRCIGPDIEAGEAHAAAFFEPGAALGDGGD